MTSRKRPLDVSDDSDDKHVTDSCCVLALLEEMHRCRCAYCGSMSPARDCMMSSEHRPREPMRQLRVRAYIKRLRDLTPSDLDEAIDAARAVLVPLQGPHSGMDMLRSMTPEELDLDGLVAACD
jgi:hypothetical protein